MNSERAPEKKPVTAGFNLVGHLTTRMGLGRAARMTLETIESNQWPVSIVDVHFSGIERVPLPSTAGVGDIRDLQYSATLLHMNPEQVVDGLLVWHPELLADLSKRYLAAVPYWELPALPEYWIHTLRGMDEVLAPSHFIEANIRAALGQQLISPKVSYYMQAVQPPEGVRPERERWFRARANTTVFLASFDVVSDIERKNPHAVVDAFCAAAEHRDDLTLALKIGHAEAAEAGSAYQRLMERVSSDPRVVLIGECLSDRGMWSLLASSDAYISLHRAEGLGLGLMESMALGTPVIGTNWSGNTDFMGEGDSILVPYQLVPVAAAFVPLYIELNGSTVWAEPDWRYAARAMRELADSSDLRAQLGRAARESAQKRWRDYLRADSLRAIMESSTTADLASVARHDRLARLEAMLIARRRASERGRRRSMPPFERARRAAVRTLRAVGLKPPAPESEVEPGQLEIVNPYDVASSSGPTEQEEHQ